MFTGTEQENLEAVLAAFEEETGATVDYTSTGDDVGATLGPRIAAGDAPDVAFLPQPGLMRDFVADGSLQPVQDVAGDLVDENYDPIWRELGSVDGTLYGVWFKAANKSTFWYNVGVFDDAGVEAPQDWAGLQDVAQTISDSGVAPISIGGADGWTLTDWFENVYIRTAGPEMYDMLAAHELPWTDESVTTALTTLAEVFGSAELLAGGTEGALQTDFETSVAKVFAEPPDGAMVYEGDFVASVISDDIGAELGTDADFFDFPSIGGSEPTVVGGGDVAVLLSDSEAGRELIRFLATPEAAEIWAERGGFLSPNQQVDLEVYPDDITRSLAESLVEAETFRFDLSDLQPAAFGGTIGQGMWKLLQDFLADPSAVDAIAQQLETQAAAAFG